MTLIFSLGGPDHLNSWHSENISAAILIGSIIEWLPTPSIPKWTQNPYYTGIRYMHQLLMENAALIKSALGGGKNVYLRIVLPTAEYEQTTKKLFVHPLNPGRNTNIPAWKLTREEHFLIWEHN